MIPSSPSGAAALHLLRQSLAQQFSQPQLSTAVPRRIEPAEIEADQYFGMNTMDITASKVRLMDRLGEAFGISMEDHATARSFGEAIRAVVDKLATSVDGKALLARIEKDLGLAELGISIETLVGAIVDPTGDDAGKLDAALGEQAGDALEEAEGEATLERLARMGLDDGGLYRII